MVGIASASVIRFGGVNASNTIQITLLNHGAHPASKRLLVPEFHLAFNQVNEPVQNEIKEQAEIFLDELLSYTILMENKATITPG